PRAGAAHRRALEFPRRAARSFLSTVKRITEHSRNRLGSTQKMHLETVRLLFCPRFGVDTANVRFGIGIGSSSHEPLPNNYVKQRENQSVAPFLSRRRSFRRRQAPRLPFFFVLL